MLVLSCASIVVLSQHAPDYNMSIGANFQGAKLLTWMRIDPHPCKQDTAVPQQEWQLALSLPGGKSLLM
jgi:hypothetical protein